MADYNLKKRNWIPAGKKWYIDVNGNFIEDSNMTQQQYEDNRLQSYRDLANDYLAERNKTVGGTNKTADQLYQEGMAKLQSDEFKSWDKNKQELFVDTLDKLESQLGYKFFNDPNSDWNLNNLSRAWVNRNNFANKYGYDNRGAMEAARKNASNTTWLPKSIYDHSVSNNNTSNPLANLTDDQWNALSFQAAAGTEFNGINDLWGVINQVNEWNGWGADWKPINSWNQWWNNASSNASNNWIQRSTNTPTQQSNGWRWITGNQGSSAEDPLATGTGSGWTAQDGGYGDMGGSNISFKQVWNNIPHIVQTQWWLNAERNMDKFKNFSL